MYSTKLFYYTRLAKACKFITRSCTNYQNPFTRTWNVLSNDIRQNKKSIYPEHADVVIIGGGFIGSSIAYWLKHRAGPGLSVVVLEKDFGFKKAQNNVLLGTLSQHYSLPENIYLAQYSAEFFRKIKEHLDDVDIQYCPLGRLVLASEKYAAQLEKNVLILHEHGTKNELLSTSEIVKRFPWIDTSDVTLGCISTEGDGVFNSSQFLRALYKKAEALGVIYVNAEVVGFGLEQQRDVLMEGIEPGSFQKITSVTYKTDHDEIHSIKFAACVLAAGNKSGDVAKLARIGTGNGLLSVPLPIQNRKYNVYSIDNDSKVLPAGLNTPFIMDTSGLWFKRNYLENNLLCGHIPSLVNTEESLQNELSSLIQPTLENRFPGCKNMQINHLQAEECDFNAYDDTGILGPHVYHGTLFLATGFGMQGCQHAPGIGRAVAELIIDSNYSSIDLTRFAFDRLLTDNPLIEFNVY